VHWYVLLCVGQLMRVAPKQKALGGHFSVRGQFVQHDRGVDLVHAVRRRHLDERPDGPIERGRLYRYVDASVGEIHCTC
jgi:hypothetical protein